MESTVEIKVVGSNAHSSILGKAVVERRPTYKLNYSSIKTSVINAMNSLALEEEEYEDDSEYYVESRSTERYENFSYAIIKGLASGFVFVGICTLVLMFGR